MSYWDDSPILSLGSSEHLHTDIGWSAKHRGFTMVNQEKMGGLTTISDDIRKRFGEMTGHINDNTGTSDCMTNKNGSIWGTPRYSHIQIIQGYNQAAVVEMHTMPAPARILVRIVDSMAHR